MAKSESKRSGLSSHSGIEPSTTASPLSQFKRDVAAKPYGEQVQMLRPTLMPGPLQLEATSPAAKTDGIHEAAAAGTAGGGGALPHLGTIQKSFGNHDVGGVNAHTGGAAAAACQAIGAKAFATGNDVAFSGSADLHTAAHEAAHVVQQRGGVSLPGGVGQAGDKYENHADQVADAVVQGKSAEPLLNAVAGTGRSEAVQRVAGPGKPAVQLVTLYRGMQAASPGDDKPLLGNTNGYQLGVRDNEGTNHKDGYVNPESGGTSTSNPRSAIPKFTASKHYPEGGHNTDDKTTQTFRWIWSIDDGNLPSELVARNDHDDHYSIEPKVGEKLSRDSLRTLVQGTQSSWTRLDD